MLKHGLTASFLRGEFFDIPLFDIFFATQPSYAIGKDYNVLLASKIQTSRVMETPFFFNLVKLVKPYLGSLAQHLQWIFAATGYKPTV